MKNLITYLVIFVTLILCMVSCTKEVIIDIPEAEQQYVVEGIIMTDNIPFLFITTSQAFDTPIDPQTLNTLFVDSAMVIIREGSNEYILDQICVEDIPEDQLEEVAELIGVDVETLLSINYCIYTSFDFLGEEGKTYHLRVEIGDDILQSSTKINYGVPLDSLWFELWSDSDSLGFIYGILSDPDTAGNAYRWYSQRVNSYPNDPGVPKDSRYIPPNNSVTEDSFYDGLTFEFGFDRGSEFNSNAEDDNNEEQGFFKVGDTIAVRPVSIEYDVFRFYRGVEEQIQTNGSPFSLPENLESNIEGGLGIWAGFGPVYDTIIAVQ